MTRFLLDSGIVGDYINQRRGVYERARAEVAKGNPIGIGVPVLAELVAGIEHSRSRERNIKTLKTALRSLRIWPFDQAAAFEYGRIYAELSRIGRPIGVVDMMIAAIAKTLGNCTVVSTDSDLNVVPGLRRELADLGLSATHFRQDAEPHAGDAVQMGGGGWAETGC